MTINIIIVIMASSIKKSNSARIFVGFSVPEHVRKEIKGAMNYYDKYLKRFVPEDNWHITLLFLGEVAEYKRCLDSVAKDITCLFLPTLSVVYIGKGLKRSQLWAYVEKNNSVVNLRDKIISRTKKLRLPTGRGAHNFNPHIRLGDMLETAQSIGIADQPVTATFVPKKVNIYRSDLSKKMPVYSVERQINLSA